MIFAHPGGALEPHDLWTAWNADPVVIGALLLAALAYRAGRPDRRPDRRRAGTDWRGRCFAGALAALAVALLSPLDGLAGSLASAHMVQHLLLTLVAAPLLVLSAPHTRLLRGTPAPARRWLARWRTRLRLTRPHTAVLRHPAAVWLAYVGTLWFWHAAVPYGAALDNAVVHALEHATFLLTGVLFWGLIVRAARTGRPSRGFAVLMLFATSMQGVFLSALLTFASTPWYDDYRATAPAWGLDALADQKLAGVLMWVPGGVLYVVSALLLLAAWIRHSEPAEATPVPSPASGERAAPNSL